VAAIKKDPDLHYDTPKLTRIFAVASIALALVLIWIILADHGRQWKGIQQGFVDFDVARTQSEIDAAQAAIPKEEEEQTRARIAEARAALESQRRDQAVAERAVKRAEDELYQVDQRWRSAKAYWATARYEYEQAHVHQDTDAEAKRADYERQSADVERLVAEVQVATKLRDEAVAVLNTYSAGITAGEKKLADLELVVGRLRTKLDSIQPWWGTKYVLNQPVLDVMAPTLKIRQVVVAGIQQDIIYTSIPRVDRCMTCHMAIDRKGYEEAPEPYAGHPRLDLFVSDKSPHPMEKFGCTACHYGRDRAVDFARATHIPQSHEQEAEWEEKYDWHEPHLWDFPMLPSRFTGATCFKCHMDQDRVPESPEAREAEGFYETFGCFGCHKASGYDANIRKVGPDLARLATKVPARDWTYRWVEAPRAFRPKTRMPHYWNLENNSSERDVPYNHAEIRGVVDYLYAKSNQVTLPPLPGSGDAVRGEQLVHTLGCLGCHVVGDDPADADLPRLSRRRFGPELRGVGSKTTPEWIYQWVKNPKKLWPETKMPDLRLSEGEALDVTSYLLTLRQDDFMRSPIPAPPVAARDEMLTEFFRAKLTVDEAKAKLDAMPEDERWVLMGERTIAKYGCFGCHNIPGFEKAQPVSIDLSEEGSKSVHLFDFGYLDVPHTRHDWIGQKLQHPRSWDQGKVKRRNEYQKMPDFGFTDEEKHIGTTTVLSFVKDRVPKDMRKVLNARESALEAGRRLVRERNCRGCHELEGEGRAIQEALLHNFLREGVPEADAAVQADGFAPPLITIEGSKVQPDWLFRFLQNPSTVRSWLKIRMPSFEFTDKELNTLIAYFNAISQEVYPFQTPHDLQMTAAEREAGVRLASRDYFNCFACHAQGEAKIEGPASQWAPNLSLANGRLKPDWIVKWIENPTLIQPGTKMPTYFDPGGFDQAGPPDVLEGDEHAQIRALMKYVLALGNNQRAAVAPARGSSAGR